VFFTNDQIAGEIHSNIYAISVSCLEPTIMKSSCENQTVKAFDDIKLECHAVTDSDEMSSLKVTWLRDGHPIDYDSQERITFNSVDNSLNIVRAEVDDTAAYICHGNNGLDESESDPVYITVPG